MCFCDGSYCSKCQGIMTAIVGALILLNKFVWPKWWGFDGWFAFFGLLALVFGIVRAYKPTCGCEGHAPMAMPAKKKR